MTRNRGEVAGARGAENLSRKSRDWSGGHVRLWMNSICELQIAMRKKKFFANVHTNKNHVVGAPPAI